MRQDKDGNPAVPRSWLRKVAFASLRNVRAVHLAFGAFDWADEPELPLVFHHVWRFTSLSPVRPQFHVSARTRNHGSAQRWLFEGGRDAGALPHHGEMDAGLLCFLGLHRLWPIHAHLVREHAGRDGVFSSPETPSRGGP